MARFENCNTPTPSMGVRDCVHYKNALKLFILSHVSVVCGWLWKEPVFWCWDEDADLEMDRVTADAPSDHHW